MKKERRKYGRPYNEQLKADNLVIVGDSPLMWTFNPRSISGLPYLTPVLVHFEELKYGNN